MITNYSIKMKDNEEILYLYFDYEYELASFENKKSLSLKEQIKNYINSKKIKFNGQKIGIVVAGIVVAIISISPLLFNDPSVKSISYVNNILVTDILINNNSEIMDEDIDILEEINIEEENQILEQKTSNEKTTNISSTNKGQTNKPETNNNTSPNQVIENKPETNNIIDNRTYVTVQRSNGQTISIELEEYIIGVVGAEMPASFNIEALKSQAIISRTYALKRISENKILTDTVSTQAYKDNNQLKALWGSSYTTYYNKIKQAVETTEGLILTHNGVLIDAVYHSTSNGYTADSSSVWGYDIPYLKSVDSSWDKNVSSYLKTTTKDFNILSSIFGINFNEDTITEVLSKDSTGRISSIKVDNNIYSGIDFRNLLGLRSADFDISFTNNGIEITTRGYGHGVGLSQYGANEMAKLGYSYNNILKHYYTGINIVKK